MKTIFVQEADTNISPLGQVLLSYLQVFSLGILECTPDLCKYVYLYASTLIMITQLVY